jgi:hypothetical protein
MVVQVLASLVPTVFMAAVLIATLLAWPLLTHESTHHQSPADR